MSRIIVLTILVAVICICNCGPPPEPAKPDVKPDASETKVVTTRQPVILEVDSSNNNNNNNVNNNVNKTTNATIPIDKKTVKNHTQEITVVQPVDFRTLNESALRRLFYVLLGLSTITVCYVALKMYRVRKGVTRPTHVRKYGVLTQRSDIEMEPLHLDDDEDDDTVFDVGVHANR